MGSFEKLGILVIVLIIVMILVVAVYQWGGADFEAAPEALRVAPYTPPAQIDPPHERDLEDLTRDGTAPPDHTEKTAMEREPAPQTDKTGRRGVPVQYIVRRNDSVWKLVRRWGLRDAFIERIRKENGLSQSKLAKLRVGQKLSIPDPQGYFRGAKYRTYVVREGDSLSTLAETHLGSSRRWQEIQTLNPSISPKRLRPGMELKFPTK
jgi:nucleoid-associated protein YgaU